MLINSSKPIGCRAMHFYRQVGKSKVCMYCGNIKMNKNDKQDNNNKP